MRREKPLLDMAGNKRDVVVVQAGGDRRLRHRRRGVIQPPCMRIAEYVAEHRHDGGAGAFGDVQKHDGARIIQVAQQVLRRRTGG